MKDGDYIIYDFPEDSGRLFGQYRRDEEGHEWIKLPNGTVRSINGGIALPATSQQYEKFAESYQKLVTEPEV